MDVLVSGLFGILGGIISSLVIAILSQRKNNAEIAHLQAETRRINFELEKLQSGETRELLSLLLGHIYEAVGRASVLTRIVKELPVLSGKSDEEISQYFEGSNLSKYELELLLKAADKDAFYAELERWHEFAETEKATIEYHNFLIQKKIFIDNEELLAACFDLDKLLNGLVRITGLSLKKIAVDSLDKTYREYGSTAIPLVEKIEKLIKLSLKPKHFSK